VLEAGHRRVAFLGNAASIFTARRRFDGFSRALEEFNLRPEPELVRQGHQDPSAARRAMDFLLRLSDPPTAVFCTNNRSTIGALEAIGAYRTAHPAYRPPTVVGFDDVELAHLMHVPLMIISHDPEQLGKRAAELLFDRIEDPRFDRKVRLVEMPVTVKDLAGHATCQPPGRSHDASADGAADRGSG
jgi:LacI family transcriptional regulator